MTLNNDKYSNTMDTKEAQCFLGLAKSYLIAADVLITAKNTGIGEPLIPTYYLLCHALELALKAFLLANGCSHKELKRYGHDLIRCHEEANKKGLTKNFQFSSPEILDLTNINDYYKNKELEYLPENTKIKVSPPFPPIEYFRESVNSALNGIFNPLTEEEFRIMMQQ